MGSVDVQRYSKVFREGYGFHVYPQEDDEYYCKYTWTKSEMMGFIEKHLDKLHYEDYDSLIVVHRGHGAHGSVLSSEMEDVAIADLHALVADDKFKDKPKIFIFDACRGQGELKDDDSKQGGPDDDEPGYTPQGHGSNLVTLYGNRDGCKSWESPEYGGWFSQSLIHALLRNAVRPRALSLVVQRAEHALNRVSEGNEVVQYVGDPQIAYCALYPNIDVNRQRLRELHNELVPEVGEDQFDDPKDDLGGSSDSKFADPKKGWYVFFCRKDEDINNTYQKVYLNADKHDVYLNYKSGNTCLIAKKRYCSGSSWLRVEEGDEPRTVVVWQAPGAHSDWKLKFKTKEHCEWGYKLFLKTLAPSQKKPYFCSLENL